MSDFILYLHKCTNHSKSFISNLFFKLNTPKIMVYMIKFQSSITQHRMISLWKFYHEDTSKKSSHTCSEESSFYESWKSLILLRKNLIKNVFIFGFNNVPILNFGILIQKLLAEISSRKNWNFTKTFYSKKVRKFWKLSEFFAKFEPKMRKFRPKILTLHQNLNLA